MKLKGERVAVCGAGGFIGGHLVKYLQANGVEVVRAIDIKPLDEWYQVSDNVENVVADLKEKDNCYKAAKGASVIFQLAADMGGMGFIENNKALCMLSVLTTTHMLMAAKDSGVKRFFYSSSACVYNGDKQKDENVVPLKEEDAYPALAEDGYGWEKLFSERMCRHFEEDFGLECRVARYHDVYGPHGTWDGGREKAPAAMFRKVLEAKADQPDGRHRGGDRRGEAAPEVQGGRAEWRKRPQRRHYEDPKGTCGEPSICLKAAWRRRTSGSRSRCWWEHTDRVFRSAHRAGGRAKRTGALKPGDGAFSKAGE